MINNLNTDKIGKIWDGFWGSLKWVIVAMAVLVIALFFIF